MRLCTGVSRGEFAFFARPRATSRAMNLLNLFESRLPGLHGYRSCRNPHLKNVQFCTLNSDNWRRSFLECVRPGGLHFSAGPAPQ